MSTTSDYLKQLQKDKDKLVSNLNAKGVNADSKETFTTLVPKVSEIKSKPKLQSKTVNPTENGTEVKTDNNYDGLEKVTINPIKANMINKLKADNIKKGIEILDIVGTYGATSQIKYATPSQEQQIIKPDEGIEFLSQVTINPVTSSIDEDITPMNIRKGVNILGIEGAFKGDFNLQEKTVTPTIKNDLVVTPDSGYDALTQITVKGVTASIDSDIQPENIKRGIEILGVEGTYAPNPSMENKEIVPATYDQVIYPDEGYSYFDKVTVKKVTSSIDENIQSNNIRNGTKILNVVGTLEPVNGEEIYVTPTTSSQTIYPRSGKNAIIKATINPVTNSIDANIIDTNIKKGVTILGVDGNYEGATLLQTKTVIPSSESQNVVADNGYDALSNVIVEGVSVEDITVEPTMQSQTYTRSDGKFINSVTVNQVTSNIDANIVPENIKQNMSILGVVGTYKGEQQNYFGSISVEGSSQKPGVIYSILNIPEDVVITSGKYAFANCTNLVKVPRLDYSTLSNCMAMFQTCSNMVDGSGATNFKNIKSAESMFSGCKKLTNLDLRSWDTKNLTSIAYAFSECSSLTTLDLSSWDVTKLTNIRNAFQNCYSLMHLDIRNFDFTKITTYVYAFNYIPDNCLIIVADDTAKNWIINNMNVLHANTALTNIKTVAEL